jgi:hypothetical protein
MSSAPRNVVEPVQPEPNPLNRPVQIDPFAVPSLEVQIDRDLRSLSMFRSQERADRLRGVTEPLRINAAEQVVASLGDDFLLQKYGTAMRSFEGMQRAPQTKQEAEVQGIVREQEADDADSPLRAFAFDAVAGVIGATQKAGIAAWEVAGTLADLTPQSAVLNHFFGSSVGDPIREIAQDYRDRVLSGESSDMPFLQEMNVRANRRGTWGVATGDLVAQALPSLGVALRSTVAARRVAAGLSWVFGTQAAGNGIEKYRREAIARGEQPSAGVAFMVGVGYAAAEYATENIDRVVPWQRIGAASAAKIGESIVGGKANAAGRYLANAAGLAGTEGLEEVIAGDLQSFVDMAAGSSSERTNAERLEEFVMGAAGAGVIVGAGSMLPSFRQAMQEPPTFLRSSGLDMKLADDARIWLNEEAGKRIGIEAAFMRATAAAADPSAGRVPVDVPAAVAEMERMLRTVGEGRAVEAIPEEEQSHRDASDHRGVAEEGHRGRAHSSRFGEPDPRLPRPFAAGRRAGRDDRQPEGGRDHHGGRADRPRGIPPDAAAPPGPLRELRGVGAGADPRRGAAVRRRGAGPRAAGARRHAPVRPRSAGRGGWGTAVPADDRARGPDEHALGALAGHAPRDAGLLQADDGPAGSAGTSRQGHAGVAGGVAADRHLPVGPAACGRAGGRPAASLRHEGDQPAEPGSEGAGSGTGVAASSRLGGSGWRVQDDAGGGRGVHAHLRRRPGGQPGERGQDAAAASSRRWPAGSLARSGRCRRRRRRTPATRCGSSSRIRSA